MFPKTQILPLNPNRHVINQCTDFCEWRGSDPPGVSSFLNQMPLVPTLLYNPAPPKPSQAKPTSWLGGGPDSEEQPHELAPPRVEVAPEQHRHARALPLLLLAGALQQRLADLGGQVGEAPLRPVLLPVEWSGVGWSDVKWVGWDEAATGSRSVNHART